MKTSRRSYALFFWLAFLIVLSLNVLVWIYLRQVEDQFHTELESHLYDVGQVFNHLIVEYNDDVDLSLLLPDDQSTLSYLFYQQPLEEIRLRSNLQSILLLSPQGDILIAAPQNLENQTFSSAYFDQDFQRALSGITVISGLKEFAGENFMSAFTPVKNIDGFIVAILVIEAKADFFYVLANLKNRLLLFSFINLLLILLIALSLYIVIKRSMSYQAELKDQQHLVELGTMAASVAHELRNPLSIIEGTSDVIKKKYARDNDEIFQFIPEEIKRLNRLIDEFLTFSRTPQLNIEPLNIEKLVQHIQRSVAGEQQDKLKVSEFPKINFHSDKQLLTQALENIVLNAFQSKQENLIVQLDITSPDRKSLQFEIRDNGPGIPSEIQPKIFSPFFTTREKGTGLGLAITKRIVGQLQGSMSFLSNPEEGTQFTVKIPSLKGFNYKKM